MSEIVIPREVQRFTLTHGNLTNFRFEGTYGRLVGHHELLDNLQHLLEVTEFNTIPVNFITRFEIHPEYRGMGYGTYELAEWCNQREYEIIILEASPLLSEFDYNPTLKEVLNYIESLTRFYERVGLVDVDSVLGYTQKRRAMMFRNTAFYNIQHLLGVADYSK